MKVTNCITCITLATLATLCACEAKTADRTDADNTARNEVDRKANTTTPMDQSQSSDGVAVTAAIRRGIMEDSQMSINAQNCKIITDKAGVVTLRGVVDSQREKDAIASIAKSVAGTATVDNQLEIKAN